MKVLSAVFVLCLVFSSCQELDKLTQFNIDYETSTVIPKNTLIDLPITIVTPEIESNTESRFKVNDTSKDMVEEIRLTELTLTITNPEDETFSFLESVAIYLSADGLDEIKIAELTDIDENIGNTISLTPSDQNLREYLIKDQFSLRAEVATDELIPQDTDVDIYSNFFVNAKVLGI